MAVGQKTKMLGFPNESRSFDDKKSRIRFWGYDRTIEITIFVEADALRKLNPAMTGTEAEYLEAFDTARTKIYEAAEKAYAGNQKGSYAYILAAADL